MSTENLKKTLGKLNAFFADNEIPFIVTGTAALELLGVPAIKGPNDIDVKVWGLNDKQLKTLQALHDLADNKSNNDYDTTCFTFMVNNHKVNVIEVPTENAPFKQAIPVSIENENALHAFLVQQVQYALKDKMRLRREKDVQYMLDLVKIISAY